MPITVANFVFLFNCTPAGGASDYMTVPSKSKKVGKVQESIQSSTKPDPGYQWESDTSRLDITNESQKISPFSAGDHKVSINRRTRTHNRNKTEITQMHRLGTVSKNNDVQDVSVD